MLRIGEQKLKNNKMQGNPGYLVMTKNNKKGRTYHNKELVNGKVPVYLCTKEVPTKIPGHTVCTEYSDQAILCDQNSLTIMGYID